MQCRIYGFHYAELNQLPKLSESAQNPRFRLQPQTLKTFEALNCKALRPKIVRLRP